ncbi:MAG TPA: hypothetical protein VJ945_02955, partial [Flavobacteriaceae bacterium]|nr:hypothetical protein [Flavobacteriaceae bacterium]
MYKFTQIKPNFDFYCWSSMFKNLTKSITGFAAVMLFLLVTTSAHAQVPPVIPCINGQANEWDDPQLTGTDNFDYQLDVFGTNQDDIFTSSKDFKLFGADGQAYNNWTLSAMQNKSDIMNAAAVILTGIGTEGGAKADPECDNDYLFYSSNTYLFFAGDRISNNGDGQTGFWFLLNGSAPDTDATGNKIFTPEHYTNFGEPNPEGGTYNAVNCIGDLLVLANFDGGGRNAVVTVLKWVGPGNGDQGNNNSLVIVPTTARVAENNDTTTPVPNGWTVSSRVKDLT